MAKLLDDSWLEPYKDKIKMRAEKARNRAISLAGGARKLSDWANAHLYYGLHKCDDGWVFREWAPRATSMWLVGDFNSWKIDPEFEVMRIPGSDVWELRVPLERISHGQHYHLEMRWDQGRAERIPAYARRVVQDPSTHLFSAQVYEPDHPYLWRHERPKVARGGKTPRKIYEAHIGMAGEEARVSTYREFTENLLPRIKASGYDTVQLMAVMEHPYYGSFGYHVSSFFAPSSRFGTPDELKELVDEAHNLGLSVIMDLVHSHAVKNERDGLSRFDGTDYQYFHSGSRGEHPAWDSRIFDYGKTQVLHFLLSNCKYWLEEFHFDGFRFDGVTSMLYHHHGLGTNFTGYEMYFDDSVDEDAWVYLALANKVIHEVLPGAVTIAEDVSGMPGVASRLKDCGLGFDYRLSMGIPDFWFKLVSEQKDEQWSMGEIFYRLTDRRKEEKTVSYVESHDQALVGGKTFFFQLGDSEIYQGMAEGQENLAVERAVALHKMARLATYSLNAGAYLNFMGNEFGHPEWIDFPREGNGWSFAHARRQWSLADDPALKFKALGDFDRVMLTLLKSLSGEVTLLTADESAKVLAFIRADYMFVFNFNPSSSYSDFGIIVPPASSWIHLFDSDEKRFSGQGRIEPKQTFSTVLTKANGEIVQQVKLYLPQRTALVMKRARKCV